ncbi:MAG: signal peptidase I [Clostridiales bacterium]|jgi:signal peptidase I|nr:signal peptidase I [Clostridiales bacterium]
MKDRIVDTAYEVASVLVSSIITITIIFTFLFRLVGVSGHSMDTTLSNGDWLIVTTSYNEPKYGDIIVIAQPTYFKEPLIKRVIAVGGQTVDLDNETGTVYVDGEPLYEPYTSTPATVPNISQIDFPVVVPTGYLFCMGDNRNNSTDSRSTLVGFIDERYVLGKALTRIIPFGKWSIYK